jgi:hypothetical protein
MGDAVAPNNGNHFKAALWSRLPRQFKELGLHAPLLAAKAVPIRLRSARSRQMPGRHAVAWIASRSSQPGNHRGKLYPIRIQF